MRKALTLEDIDFRAKARKDLPYLKDKAREYLELYSKETDWEKKKEYITLHFSYMDFYHGTKIMLDGEDK